jgi:hypothetical protein
MFFRWRGQIERPEVMSIGQILKRVGIVALGVIAALVVGIDPAVGEERPVGTAPSAVGTSNAGAGLVFGRLRLFYKDKEVEFSRVTNRVQLFIRTQQTGEIQRKDFTGDQGKFSWSLPVGEYVIVGYQYLTVTGRLWLTFYVPDPGEANYIGDLHIMLQDGRYGWQVRDAFAEAEQDSDAGLAKEGAKAIVALMRPERRLGSYRRMTSICATVDWGIACDRTNQGVKPLSPVQSTQGFPTVDRLTPRLAWSAPFREGVTYDLAIYESISAPLLGLNHMRGPLIFYAEALPEPFYQLDTPLARGKRYEWSVRLRSGDTVSTWSTTGYFVFLIIAAASGSGNWFGFTTPD